MVRTKNSVPWNFLTNLISTIWDSFHGAASPSYDLFFNETDVQNANTELIKLRTSFETWPGDLLVALHILVTRKVQMEQQSGGQWATGTQWLTSGAQLQIITIQNMFSKWSISWITWNNRDATGTIFKFPELYSRRINLLTTELP